MSSFLRVSMRIYTQERKLFRTWMVRPWQKSYPIKSNTFSHFWSQTVHAAEAVKWHTQAVELNTRTTRTSCNRMSIRISRLKINEHLQGQSAHGTQQPSIENKLDKIMHSVGHIRGWILETWSTFLLIFARIEHVNWPVWSRNGFYPKFMPYSLKSPKNSCGSKLVY